MSKEYEYFKKHYGNADEGYTREEAEQRKAKIDESHNVFGENSKWEESIIEPDPSKKSGYLIKICPK